MKTRKMLCKLIIFSLILGAGWLVSCRNTTPFSGYYVVLLERWNLDSLYSEAYRNAIAGDGYGQVFNPALRDSEPPWFVQESTTETINLSTLLTPPQCRNYLWITNSHDNNGWQDDAARYKVNFMMQEGLHLSPYYIVEDNILDSSSLYRIFYIKGRMRKGGESIGPKVNRPDCDSFYYIYSIDSISPYLEIPGLRPYIPFNGQPPLNLGKLR